MAITRTLLSSTTCTNRHFNKNGKQPRSIILTLLASTLLYGTVFGEGVQSTVIVKDPGGSDVGPQITLSATVLTTGDQLDYKCIEGGDYETNRLARIMDDGTIKLFEKSSNVDGSFKNYVCNYAVDRVFMCTIVSGSIVWERNFGGKYCCAAARDEWYYVHWINPVLHVSGDRELSSNEYGSEQRFHCSVDMTPTTISYNGIFNVEWQWFGSQTKNEWKNLVLSDKVTSTISATGANYTLTIKDFNPIKNGGNYRCQATVTRYNEPLTSGRFSVTSLPKAILKNNKRSDFIFGLHETNVKFTCEALSYPFPDKVEFRLEAKVVDGNTKGVTDYEADLLSINVDVHKATFFVNNMSELFRNDTVFECRVYAANGELSQSQERIILKEETPPIETTTMLMLDGVNPNKENQSKAGTEPWVIALAVIIPIVIILIIVVLLVWRCRKRSYGESRGNGYYTTHAMTNDLSRGYNSQSRNSLRSQRDPSCTGDRYSSLYAQSKIHHNPIYGSRPPGSSCYGQVGGMYDTPRPTGSMPRQSRPGTMTREYRPESLPRQPAPPPPSRQDGTGSMPRQGSGSYTAMYATPHQNELDH